MTPDKQTRVVKCRCGAKFRVPGAKVGKHFVCKICGIKVVIKGPPRRKQAGPTAPPATIGPESARSAPSPMTAGPVPSSRESLPEEFRIAPESIPVALPAPPGPEPVDAIALPDESEPASLDDKLFDDMGAVEELGITIIEEDKQQAPACSQCGTPLAAGAVLCTACGYNASTGKSLSAPGASVVPVGRGTKHAQADPVEDTAGNTIGRFLLGLLLSFVGAGVGGGIWFTVAMLADYELGIIAWALGGLTGLGMALGYRRSSIPAGSAAAIIAFGAVISTRIMIAVFFLVPVVEAAIKPLLVDDPRIHRLADHRTALSVRASGTPFGDFRQPAVWRAEFDKILEMSEEELDETIADLDAWEAGGKWADETYVRDALIYQHIDELRARENEATYDPAQQRFVSQDAWKAIYATAKMKVEGLAHAAQVKELKAMLLDTDRKTKRRRLASHRAERRAEQIGLDYYDEKRGTFLKEEYSKTERLDETSLNRAITELDAWENGKKWEDRGFVRDYLIYGFIAESARESQEGQDDLDMFSDEYEPYFEPDEWKNVYENAVAQVEDIPSAQRREAAQSLQDERELHEQQQLAERQVEQLSEAVVGTSDSVGSAASSLFAGLCGPIDLIFILLAVGTAFRIAQLGRET